MFIWESSGRLSKEPLCYRLAELTQRLSHIPSFFLWCVCHHEHSFQVVSHHFCFTPPFWTPHALNGSCAKSDTRQKLIDRLHGLRHRCPCWVSHKDWNHVFQFKLSVHNLTLWKIGCIILYFICIHYFCLKKTETVFFLLMLLFNSFLFIKTTACDL